MPFSSLSDPADLARAQRALDRAWLQLTADVPAEQAERERSRLAVIIGNLARSCADEAELVARALERFRH